MDFNTVTLNLTLREARALLVAFTNWMDTDKSQWTEDGKAVNRDYRAIIYKLEESISAGALKVAKGG